MRTLFISAFLWLAAHAYSDDPFEIRPQDNWNLFKNSPLFSFSAEFDCKKGEILEGKVIRTGRFCPRYFYDLYDPREVLEARGITRVFSLGFLFSWGMEIDVYDGDFMIGKLEGKLFTKARAKFVFYDAYGSATAIAYLNTEHAEFVIVSAQNEAMVLSELKGKAYGDVSVWEMNFIESFPTIDPRMLKIFAAFVADYHSEFLPPPKEINHYYFYPSFRYDD